RINFVNPVTGEEKKGNSKGSMFLIWRPFITPRRLSSFALKQELKAIGNQYLADVRAA
ncbi:DNA N-6-adenine-methyltransferase, partial [Morganella morganii]